MADNRDSPDDLYPFARALVRKLVNRYQLTWDSHRKEDAEQDLFLAGWQVWQETQDIGLAKNRMASRKYNLLRDSSTEKKHEPKLLSAVQRKQKKEAIQGQFEARDFAAELGFETATDRASQRGDPVEELIVQAYLNRLTERQRDIVLLRMAGNKDSEIAEQLGISLRTVERELAHLRKERTNEPDA